MARLTDASGCFLLLEPLDYESPAGRVWELHDLNWLLTRLSVGEGGEVWSVRAGTLLTWELHGLVTWLRTVAAAPAALPPRWKALEPSIKLDAERTDDGLQLRVLLNWKFIPPARCDDGRCFVANEDSVIVFTPTDEELCRFADELEREMHRFPVRPEPPGYPVRPSPPGQSTRK
jgi:hypothetical protein